MLRLLFEPHRSVLPLLHGALLSATVHAAVIGGALLATRDAQGLPERGRLLPAFFLLPPDRRPAEPGRLSPFEWPDLGQEIGSGARGEAASDGLRSTPPSRTRNSESGTGGNPGHLPLQREAISIDSVFSVLAVDSPVVRYEGSSAPAYPPDLMRDGIEGLVYAQFVVDTIGLVDASSIHILVSTHPGFAASVHDALGMMRFHPAVRGWQRVRQLVEQHFVFLILRTEERRS
ncbi:MAG: energy transducer TonB [Gemmatimonadales bacterium]